MMNIDSDEQMVDHEFGQNWEELLIECVEDCGSYAVYNDPIYCKKCKYNGGKAFYLCHYCVLEISCPRCGSFILLKLQQLPTILDRVPGDKDIIKPMMDTYDKIAKELMSENYRNMLQSYKWTRLFLMDNSILPPNIVDYILTFIYI